MRSIHPLTRECLKRTFPPVRSATVFYPQSGNAALYFNEGRESRISNRELVPPPPAEHCALRLEFAQDGNLTVYVKEAKKKACDKFKTLAGVYAPDYAQVPVQ